MIHISFSYLFCNIFIQVFYPEMPTLLQLLCDFLNFHPEDLSQGQTVLKNIFFTDMIISSSKLFLAKRMKKKGDAGVTKA